MKLCSAQTLEAALIRNAAPTLSGVMPANLFTVPGHFLYSNTRHGAATKREAAAYRAALLEAVRVCEASLAHAGIRIAVLVWRGCNALLYVYQAPVLERIVAEPQVRRALEELGYPLTSLTNTLAYLGARIAQSSTCARPARLSPAWPLHAASSAKADSFPHEVGYLLGYPTCDVEGFIAQDGLHYQLLGPWKVYNASPQTLTLIERIHRARARCHQCYQRGTGLRELAVACA